MASPPLTDHQKAEDPGEHFSPGSSVLKINLTDNRCTDVPRPFTGYVTVH